MNSPTQQELDRLKDRFAQQPDSRLFAPLADCHRKLGQLEEAADLCKQGLERYPRYSSAYVILAKIQLDMAEKNSAEESFRKVLEIDPQNLLALHQIALLHEERGEISPAMECWRQILSIEPGSEDGEANLERLQAIDSPVPEEDSAKEISPASGDSSIHSGGELATITLAEIYRDQGFFQKALDVYREVLHRSPDSEEIRAKIQEIEDQAICRSSDAPSDAPLEELESTDYGDGVLSAGLLKDEDDSKQEADGDPAVSFAETTPDSEEKERFDHFKTWLDRIKVRDS